MRLSRRLPWDLSPSSLAEALDRAPIEIDLTELNPTRAGLEVNLEAAVLSLRSSELNRYDPKPFGSQAARLEIARYTQNNVPAERLVLCNSTSEAYSLLFKLLCDPGDSIAVPTPSYPLIAHLAELEGVGVQSYRLTYQEGWHIDFQSLEINATPLYQKVSEKIVEWSAKANGNLGAVIGATSIQELEKLHAYFSSSAQSIPYLIPGIGKQGGSILEVMRVLSGQGSNIQLHRINSSSEINYAYKKQNTTDYAGAAVKALRELNAATKW